MLDPGKIYLVIEDTGNGKDYWSSILDNTKITVVSLHDVSDTLSGNKSFPKFLMHLDTNKSTFLFLPDTVDIYQNNLTASIWSRIYRYANNKGDVIDDYIGFEWLFVNSDTVCSSLNSLLMSHINEYNKGYKISHSKRTKNEYKAMIQDVKYLVVHIKLKRWKILVLILWLLWIIILQ